MSTQQGMYSQKQSAAPWATWAMALGLVALGAVGGAWWAGGQTPDAPPESVPDREERDPEPAAPVAPAAPPDGLDEAVVMELEDRVQDLEVELDAARSEAQRYRSGLEKAVAELNRQKARGEGAEAARLALQRETEPRLPPPRRDPHRALKIWDYEVSVGWNEVTVHGKIHNAGSTMLAGTIEVTLFKDGEPFAETKYVDASPQGGDVVDYRVQWSPTAPDSSYTAEVQWAPNRDS
ncbi:MAG: hypothetical protein AAGN66_06930 [Acidobacteriota bacterium]